jgi:DNA polymerase (family 10)
MNARELSKAIALLAAIRDWQKASVFKVKALQKIALTLKPLSTEAVVAGSYDHLFSDQARIWIKEALQQGVFIELEQAKNEIPSGILEFFKIKGVGPRKWRMVYDDLGIEDVMALEQACLDLKLSTLKGLGVKTQTQILEQLQFLKHTNNKYLFSEAYKQHVAIDGILRSIPQFKYAVTGCFARHLEVIDCMEYLVSDELVFQNAIRTISLSVPVKAIVSKIEDWGYNLLKTIGPKSYLDVLELHLHQHLKAVDDMALHAQLHCAYVPPSRRDAVLQKQDLTRYTSQMIDANQLKGVLHVHTTYSDGANSIQEMAQYAMTKGYSYLGITDHSQSAFYANGLTLNRLYDQWHEIEKWNSKHPECFVFKGIESDIRADGSLDYNDDVLKNFDFVIASIHSGLQMDEVKATSRLIKAIEHPSTRILGHLTGRLLLNRSGYPVNVPKIIQACAQHHVAIELNSNPYRLDIDWRWIDYALEQGVWIALNPDAHSCFGIDDMFYGVCMAQKTLLTSAQCLNALDTQNLFNFFNRK